MDKNRIPIKPIVNHNTTVVVKDITLSALILGSIIAVTGTTIPGPFGENNAAWAGTFPGNNGKIAFVSTRDANNAEIYVMNADGTVPTRLTTDPTATPFVDEQPSWSADGSKIAFRSTRGGGGIYVMNADGTGITRIADGHQPSWSPDGSKIAFTSANSDIYVMNADGTGITPLATDPAQDTKPSWSPDGNKIAFTSGRLDDGDGVTDTDIYTMNAADGSGLTRLTTDPAPHPGPNDVSPSWSPDGSKIAFQSNRDFTLEIYSMNAADGSGLTRLTNNFAVDTEPSWSPDGSRIAFQEQQQDGNLEIYSINAADGTNPTNLSQNPSADTDPDWGTHGTTPPNQPPTANAGADFAVDEGTTGVQLQGSGADSDGSITSYLWEQIDGPAVTLSNADTSTATFDAPSVTTSTPLTFNLTVTDNDGASASDTVVVTVNNLNQAPTANAGADFAVDEGTTGVQLDGSASTDSDGTILSYLWEQTDGPSVTLNNADTATATFDAPSVNEETPLIFNLTVTDNDGASASDTVVVTVNNVNQLPTANAGPDQTVNEGDTVTLDGTGSLDADGTIASYLWEQSAGTAVTLNGADTATATFTAPPVTSSTDLTFKLTVTDNDGGTAEDSVVVTVNNVNQAPTAALTANPTTINEGETSALDASGSTDPDGDELTYTFAVTSGPPGSIDQDGSPTATYNAPSDVEGTEETATIQVTVDDGNGGTDTATVQVTVKYVPPETTIDSAVDGKGKQISNGGSTTSNTITFTFSGTDNTGVAGFLCSIDGAAFSSCGSGDSGSITYTKVSRGTHTFQVKAVDTSDNEDPTPAEFSWKKPK